MVKKHKIFCKSFCDKIFILILFNLVPFLVSGQVIKGKVVDELNQSVIGANVILKGTAIGAVTDFEGNFAIDISKSKVRVLEISYTGYLKKEVFIDKQEYVLITLSEDKKVLDEVVLIGYGTKKKKDLTGSVASLSAKDFQKVPVTNVEDLIAHHFAHADRSCGFPCGIKR